MTDDAASPGELRLVLQKVARRIRAERGDSEVTDSQMAVLWRLDKSGTASPGELAAAEKVSPPSMNRIVNALQEAGYATRTQHDDDGRRVVVTLTAAGRAVTAETRRLRDEWFSRHLALLSEEERTQLLAVTDILRKLAES